METKYFIKFKEWSFEKEGKTKTLKVTYECTSTNNHFYTVNLKTVKWIIINSNLRSEDEEISYEEVKKLFPLNTPYIDEFDGHFESMKNFYLKLVIPFSIIGIVLGFIWLNRLFVVLICSLALLVSIYMVFFKKVKRTE
jgi:hypothetical protein